MKQQPNSPVVPINMCEKMKQRLMGRQHQSLYQNPLYIDTK